MACGCKLVYLRLPKPGNKVEICTRHAEAGIPAERILKTIEREWKLSVRGPFRDKEPFKSAQPLSEGE